MTNELTILPKFGEQSLKVLGETTPKDKIKERPGNGGMRFKYVETGYVVAKLDEAFGRLWEWEILTEQVGNTQVWVKGRLTVHLAPNFSLKKEAFGSSDIKKYTATKLPIDIGNDMKSASSDALKKAASYLGVASDVYFPNEYQEPVKGQDER